MDNVTKEALLSAIRSLLIILGSVLAAHGFLSSGDVNIAIGAVMTILPVVWGVWDKYQSEKRTQAREVVAANTAITTIQGSMASKVSSQSVTDPTGVKP